MEKTNALRGTTTHTEGEVIYTIVVWKARAVGDFDAPRNGDRVIIMIRYKPRLLARESYI